MKLLEAALDWLFPPKCVFCRKVLENTGVCGECVKKLPYTKGDSIVQSFPHIKKCVTPLYYDGTVREAILRYKFWGMTVYADTLGAIMAECVENNLDCGDIDVISYVPLSRKRLRKRGYNQSHLLAEAISRRIDVPMAETLIKIADNPAQSGIKSREARAKNVKGMYAVMDTELVKGKAVLLVDDVVTTGATLSECAKTLRDAGALYVYCTALARRKD